jgi:hypothetical protein
MGQCRGGGAKNWFGGSDHAEPTDSGLVVGSKRAF